MSWNPYDRGIDRANIPYYVCCSSANEKFLSDQIHKEIGDDVEAIYREVDSVTSELKYLILQPREGRIHVSNMVEFLVSYSEVEKEGSFGVWPRDKDLRRRLSDKYKPIKAIHKRLQHNFFQVSRMSDTRPPAHQKVPNKTLKLKTKKTPDIRVRNVNGKRFVSRKIR